MEKLFNYCGRFAFYVLTCCFLLCLFANISKATPNHEKPGAVMLTHFTVTPLVSAIVDNKINISTEQLAKVYKSYVKIYVIDQLASPAIVANRVITAKQYGRRLNINLIDNKNYTNINQKYAGLLKRTTRSANVISLSQKYKC